jgi:hypothetical protein
LAYKDLEINAFEEIKVRNLLYRKMETAELRVEKAVPWLMGLVAGLIQWRPGFALGNSMWVVDKVALGQVFLRVLRFYLSISFHRGSPYSYI